MPPIVKDLLLSKKFVVAFIATIGSVASYFGWNVDPTAILLMMTPFLIYIGAQGWGADNGKEKAKIEQETQLKLQANHAAIDSARDVMMASDAAQKPVSGTINKAPEGSGAVLSTAIVAALTFGLGGVFVAACSHPKQSALSFGQCALDGGVLGEVIAALGQPNYEKLVEAAAIKHAAGLVDCALIAVASQPSGAGSGSATSPITRTEAPPADTLSRRAREVLEHRKAASK